DPAAIAAARAPTESPGNSIRRRRVRGDWRASASRLLARPPRHRWSPCARPSIPGRERVFDTRYRYAHLRRQQLSAFGHPLAKQLWLNAWAGASKVDPLERLSLNALKFCADGGTECRGSRQNVGRASHDVKAR